ncbi:O-acetylserine/cysteine efflux transporter [Streptomyces sp. 2224.1]|uniref:EamA family transporter n=1 Tax=Streptomyces sp. 2224.1 TaxID=1881020 RepID=UPI00089D670E|nr:EamA family transporter [Streptomyces sp. 2224.1]SED32434.1 O-acetylserine/cysteine efflux transporter [Streptomyces sp. 2224.1]
MKPVHVALAVAVAAVWGANFVVIDVGLRDFPPLLFSAVRFLLAAFPAVFFVGRPQVAWRWVVAVGVTLGIMKFGMLFLGMHAGLPPGLASLVLQGQAVFTVLFAAVLLKERARRVQIAGTAIASVGIVLAGLDSTAGTLTGFLLVVGAAACWGLSNIAMRKAGSPDAFRFMVWVSVVPPVPLALLSVLFEGGDADLRALQQMNLSGLGAALYVAWGATLFGFATWGYLLRIYDAPTVAPFSLLVPVFGLASAWLFQGEHMTPVTFCAAALVVVGIAVGMLRRKNKPMPPEGSRCHPKPSERPLSPRLAHSDSGRTPS